MVGTFWMKVVVERACGKESEALQVVDDALA